MFHRPGDWLVGRTSARERRSLATWTLILACVTLPIRFLWKDAVWQVWALSELAILISLITTIFAETPVEHETPKED